MIATFADKTTEDIFNGKATKHARRIPKELWRHAARKLDAIDATGDLKSLKGLGLKKLSKDRKGQYSIRINDQYRIVFSFTPGVASGVQITDYH